MKYYKNIEGEYISAIGTGIGDVEITKDEYETVLSLIHNRPAAETGYAYRLRTDHTWELVALPPEEDDPELSDAEVLDIILGGEF